MEDPGYLGDDEGGVSDLDTMSSRVRRWCFTLFDYELPLFEALPDWACYLVYQEELTPSTAVPHLQGFVVCKTPARMEAMKKRLGISVHLEAARGTSTEAANYCKKEESRIQGPWEYGVLVEQGSGKRKLVARYQEDPEDLRLEDPKAYRRVLAYHVNQEFKNLELPDFTRPWQVVLKNYIDKEPDSRSIYWVFGSEGNEGKTTFSKKLIQEGWFYSRGGKAADIKYSYAEHLGNVVFDFPRQSEDLLNYQVIEEVKDRLLTSSKYEPLQINCKDHVHVVVMANFLPSLENEIDNHGKQIRRKLLSKDRVWIVNIDYSYVKHDWDEIPFGDYMK